jgi:cell division protein ZapE
LAHRTVETSIADLLSELVPPREFTEARFATYIPHPEFASQKTALIACQSFAKGSTAKKLFGKSKQTYAGVYLDGGFGVGKTHLLASIWHEFKGKKAFGSFIAFTSLIGALGFAPAVKALSRFQLICIDEFELDDPGDTMMMSRLLNELESAGVIFAATSNTPPNALGEGRFAAADFTREIHGIADRFEMLRIDGEDHRHRPVELEAVETTQEEFEKFLVAQDQRTLAVDDFDDLLAALSKIHPSRYGRLMRGINSLGLTSVHQLHDQVNALRFVAFVDRAYEAQIQLRGTGHPLIDVFSPEYLSGGYRKKYLRAVSRLGAMTTAK